MVRVGGVARYSYCAQCIQHRARSLATSEHAFSQHHTHVRFFSYLTNVAQPAHLHLHLPAALATSRPHCLGLGGWMGKAPPRRW